LYTSRLIIRPFTIDDIDIAHAMNLDEAVSQYTGDGGVVSYDETARRIKEDVLTDYEKYGYGRMAVCLKSTKEFIGFCGIKYLSDIDKVDIGYRFFSKFWGRGYATESAKACLNDAIERLQLQEIIAFVLPENKGSIKVLEKLSFRYSHDIMEEGELARYYVFNV